MKLADLTLLRDVAEHLNFAAVARLHGSDPARISRDVARIESSLGLRLFHRSTRSMRVTDEGALYLGRVLPLIDVFAEAREAALGARSQPRGRLSLTTSVAFGQVCIVPHLPAFRAQYPHISLRLVLNDAHSDLVADGVDLAFRLGSGAPPGLTAEKMLTTRYLPVCSPDYAKARAAVGTPDALGTHDILAFDLPGFRNRWRFRDDATGAQTEVAFTPSLTATGALALLQMARDGLGVALLADWLVSQDMRAGRLTRLLPGYSTTATRFETGIWALYPSAGFLPRKTRVALEFFRKALHAPARPGNQG